MTANDQLLPAIRALADRYGLPDGLEYNQQEMWVTIVEKPTHAPRTIIEGDIWDPVFWIWLAAALAHWEAEAEVEHSHTITYHEWADGRRAASLYEYPHKDRHTPLHFYTTGDLLSRLTARTLALLDGVNAIGGEG